MEEIPNVMPEDELRHYGRKGMKWYQNVFSKPKSGATRNKSSPKKKVDEKEVKKKKKTPKEMTSEELREKIGHMQLEVEYNRLASQTKKVSRGRKFAGDMVDKAILPAAVDAGKKVATDWFTKLGRKWLGLDLESNEAKDIYAEMKKEAEYAKNQWEKADSEQKLKDLRRKQAEQTNRTKTDDSDDTSSKTTKKETYGSDNPSSSTTTGDSNKKSWYKPKSWSNNSSTSEKSRDTVVDVDWTDVSSSSTWKKGRDTVIDAEWTDISSSNTSTGRSYVSGLLNSPVAGLLEAPKD